MDLEQGESSCVRDAAYERRRWIPEVMECVGADDRGCEHHPHRVLTGDSSDF